MHMDHKRADLPVGKIETGNLLQSVASLDKAMFTELKLPKDAETDLRRADFGYWIPNSEPDMRIESWGTCMEEVYTDIQYKIRCELETLRQCLDHASSRLDVMIRCYVGWEHGYIALTHMVDIGEWMFPTGIVDLVLAHRVSADDPPHIQENAQALVREVLPIWGIPSELIPKTPTNEKTKVEIGGSEILVASRDSCLPPDMLTVCRKGDQVQETGAQFLSAVDALVEKFGAPWSCDFSVTERPNRVEVGQAFCREIAPRWDISFFGEYEDGFEPCDRPTEIDVERRYPVLRSVRRRQRNKISYEFLDLQVTAVHPPDEDSYLLLHSQRG